MKEYIEILIIKIVMFYKSPINNKIGLYNQIFTY